MKVIFILPVLLMGCLAQGQAIATENPTNNHSHAKHTSDASHQEGNDDEAHDEGHSRTDEKHRNVETGHDGEHGNDDAHKQGEKQSTLIDDAMAAQVKIKTATASPQILQQSVVVYGSLTSDPGQISHVRARYSGLITSVKHTIGDAITQGALLAEVESNESLKIYPVLAPISGTVIQRHANTGEVTQDQVLFSIANFDTLWAEFHIYSSQQSTIKTGQAAHIKVDDWEFSGPIQHIIPMLDKPYQLARVKIDNHSKGLTPGLLVEGRIIVGEFSADLAVEKAAIQTLGEQPGVFVKNSSEYVFVPLQLGRADDHYIEVLSGLKSGQLYVSKNSYLIKADIEKSEAEHDH